MKRKCAMCCPVVWVDIDKDPGYVHHNARNHGGRWDGMSGAALALFQSIGITPPPDAEPQAMGVRRIK